uniref:uncharacterized protein LOC120327705 n=1 Tax=Styela clava TaxID=7725 RepID=UPI00193950AB|nr:uncharacterized protein LOC120327705 [Styela clava]
MDFVGEQEFLSGIEPLSTSETSTPHDTKLKNSLAPLDSLNSTEDPINYPVMKPGFSPSPVKPLSSYSSPVITADSGSFTSAAQEITKHLQESLATSLKKEKQAMQSISPGPKKNDSILMSSKSPSDRYSTSPSKFKVRFDDEVTPGEGDFQSELRISFHTPPKKRDVSSTVSTTSPARRNLSHQMNMEKLSSPQTDLKYTSSNDNFMLDSLRIPSNEEERQKLFDFMKKMETSISGDPLSSLFSLQSGIKEQRKQPRQAISNGNVKPSGSEMFGKTSKMSRNEKADPNLRKKKIENRRTNPKEVGKKTYTMKNEARDQMKKVPSKKNTQKVPSTKSSKLSKQNIAKSTAAVKYTSEGQQTIDSMETVRNHLQGMLKMDGVLENNEPKNISEDYKLYFGAKDTKTDGDGPESFRSTDTATLLSAQPSDFVPPTSSPESASGDIGTLMNNDATSNIFSILRGNSNHPTTTTRSSVDSSVTVENKILRDTLEKERYRRNHCEKQIQKLQNKILEIQQELAVGQSVARKKDMMIEQLDKTLAKVVDGWKGHEEKLTKSVQQLTKEKEKFKIELEKSEETINGLQSDALNVIVDYEKMKERLQLKEEEQKLLQQTFQMKTHEISRVIDQKNSSIEKLLNDKQTMVEDINNLTKKMEQLQEEVENEKDKWTEEMLEQQKTLKQEIQSHKAKYDQEKSRNNDLQKMLSTTQQEVTRLEDLMGSLRQTIDSLKMQGSVEETKYSAALRKMEAEHQIEMEKKVTEKLSKFHEEAEYKEKELRDGHHKQVMDITKSHQMELESQCSLYEDRIEQLEHRWKQDLEDKERKFDEILKEKTENLRRQMINKMQNLLQAHYNETLEVVGNTTGNTPMRPIRSGTLSNMLQDMRSSTYLPGSTLHDISNLNITMQDTLRQTGTSRKLGNLLEPTKDSHSKATNSILSNTSSYPFVSSRLPTSFSAYQAPMTINQSQKQNMSEFIPSATVNGDHMESFRSSIINGTSKNATARNIMETRTTEAQNEQHPQLSYKEPTRSVQHITQNTFETEVNLPMGVSMTPAQILPVGGENTISPSVSQEGDRNQYLQHYIKMLLDKSPGEPIDAPHPVTAPLQPVPPPAISTLSPIVIPNQSQNTIDENKENDDDDDFIQPTRVTSEMAMDVINFLNKQLKTEPSPDLIPVEKTKTQKSPQKQMIDSELRMPQRSSSNTGSAFQQVKMTNGMRPQQFNNLPKQANNLVTKSPKKIPPQLSMKDLETSTKSFGKVTQKQLSDVSRMLGSYMNGNTQQAAEKLLSYLAQSQQKNHETSLSTSQMSIKSKNKTKTPSKAAPAWR